ncbi:hypothetical protein CRM22_002908 [Opisthorchis felineus]|uniref:CBM21 domain-containing protein n=1 Tax=Opisthorchis felineus TaxID=147828 RepID=A0A4S2M3R6_OPIFE|nr:hypothetical protein CRM22_002908 [Opisthorchis felineus]
MSSAEHLIITVADNPYNEHNHTANDEFVQSCPANPPRTYRSRWSYLKCLLWTAFTGIFNCGHIVLEQPVADQWPVIKAGEQDNEVAPAADCVCVDNNQLFSGQIVEDTKVTSIHLEPNEETLTAEYQGASEARPSEDHCAPSIAGDKLALISSNNSLDTFNETSLANLDVPFDFDADSLLLNGPCRDSHITCSPAFTLLNTYYADANNGLIDELTRDALIRDLLQSVIPRNLSDSSEVSITPEIRKMYAWAGPPTNDSEQSDAPKSQTQFDLDSTSSNSEERLPYPGKLSMSDNSFSPLSPATVESNTVIDNCDKAPTSNKYDDLNLPDVDRRDHTLAWALANMQIGEDQATECDLSGTPPLRDSFTRQSQEKSPVSSANTYRLTDTQSVPSRMDYDVFRPFEDDVPNIPKPKRSSSLKSQRTPPGTPGQKVVRFADALGLDLESVRHVFDQENPPKIPASATFDLEIDTDESIAKLGAKQFRMCFSQPGSAANFIRRVLDQTVCLEDAHVEMPRGVLNGTIRVRSLGFEKRVFVRATYNDWSTYCDTTASYVQGSHDGATDRFSFSLVFPDTMVPGRRAQFAIRYDAHTGEQFWDNNFGQNYSVMCYAKATDLAGDGSWVHYL